jgi:hypothetical protein
MYFNSCRAERLSVIQLLSSFHLPNAEPTAAEISGSVGGHCLFTNIPMLISASFTICETEPEDANRKWKKPPTKLTRPQQIGRDVAAWQRQSLVAQ